MYHHVNSDRCSNNIEVFEKHMQYIASHFQTTFPTKKELKGKYACLVFDDAYADFYYLTFPILKKYNIKALLAVPTKYILDVCSQTPEVRMSFEHNDEFKNYEKGTFCTFKEMKEMIESGLVQIASHSHTHTNLLEEDVNIKEELILSQQILEEKLSIKVESFVFPFGKYNDAIATETLNYYTYAFRIGNAIHKDFSGIKGINYRVDADGLSTADEIFTFKKQLGYKFKAFIKSF
ncbi:MAG: polysaccharide deacetylase [Arcobacter sp.]|mgnify:CR=1 FL=1|nr:MAG: polysaccharide deacetylase [Arcobacter sp.]